MTPGYTITDEELLRRAVAAVRPRRGRRSDARWVCVMDAFTIGSNVARSLCARFGHDPYEEVRR